MWGPLEFMVLGPTLEIDFLEFHPKCLLNLKNILEFIIKMIDGGWDLKMPPFENLGILQFQNYLNSFE